MQRWLTEVLLLACVCLLTGCLALVTSRPPSAPALMPAVGLALAGTLVCGYRVWPGVWLGFFGVTLVAASDYLPGLPLFRVVAVSALVAAGYTFQAIVGAWLIRHIVDYPTALTRNRDVALFLAIAGPLHSVVASSIGVTVLVGTGMNVVASAEWASWWLADTLGGVLFTRKREELKSRTYPLDGIVDRVGAGDAFAAGVLHGRIAGLADQDTLEFAVAAAVLKHSIRGDFNLVSSSDVEQLVAAKGVDIRR